MLKQSIILASPVELVPQVAPVEAGNVAVSVPAGIKEVMGGAEKGGGVEGKEGTQSGMGLQNGSVEPRGSTQTWHPFVTV